MCARGPELHLTSASTTEDKPPPETGDERGPENAQLGCHEQAGLFGEGQSGGRPCDDAA